MDTIKRIAERVTGWGRPSRQELPRLVKARKPQTFFFADDGIVPNNPNYPAVLYRGAVRLPAGLDPAAVLEDLFAANGWGGSWRAVIFDYLHYHSAIHEVLGVAGGTAKVQIGGGSGRVLALKPGDVLILPAGTGHQALQSDGDFKVVGAYPASGKYDVCTTAEDYARARRSVGKVAAPRQDPVYGRHGPLIAAWAAKARRDGKADGK